MGTRHQPMRVRRAPPRRNCSSSGRPAVSPDTSPLSERHSTTSVWTFQLLPRRTTTAIRLSISYQSLDDAGELVDEVGADTAAWLDDAEWECRTAPMVRSFDRLKPLGRVGAAGSLTRVAYWVPLGHFRLVARPAIFLGRQ